jgi:hypothetical protein
MELSFESAALRSLCERGEATHFDAPTDVASQLRHRIADLRSAQQVRDLVVGNPQFHGDIATVLQIELGTRWVLELRPNHAKPICENSGRVDWNRVHRLRVTSVKRLDSE